MELPRIAAPKLQGITWCYTCKQCIYCNAHPIAIMIHSVMYGNLSDVYYRCRKCMALARNIELVHLLLRRGIQEKR